MIICRTSFYLFERINTLQDQGLLTDESISRIVITWITFADSSNTACFGKALKKSYSPWLFYCKAKNHSDHVERFNLRFIFIMYICIFGGIFTSHPKMKFKIKKIWRSFVVLGYSTEKCNKTSETMHKLTTGTSSKLWWFVILYTT